MGLDAGAWPRPGMRGRDRGGKRGAPFLLDVLPERKGLDEGDSSIQEGGGVQKEPEDRFGGGTGCYTNRAALERTGKPGLPEPRQPGNERSKALSRGRGHMSPAFSGGQLERVGCRGVLRGQ